MFREGCWAYCALFCSESSSWLTSSMDTSQISGILCMRNEDTLASYDRGGREAEKKRQQGKVMGLGLG